MTAQAPALIHQLVVKIASRCNLDCGYCYMYHGADQSWTSKPKLMSEEVYSATLDRVVAYCENHRPHKIGLSLHGGEPLLVGKRRFRHLVETARRRLGDRLLGINVQTNATLISDEWALLLAELNIMVGVSIDGPKEVHDAARPDRRGGGSYDRVRDGLIRLRAAGIDPMGLCVIDPKADGAAVYDHLRALGLRKIDLLIPDVTHETVDQYRDEDDDTPVGDFILAAADRWLQEDDAEVEVRILYGLFRRLMGGLHKTDAFGNPRLSYLVIESDGGIEGNDVLKVCAPGLPQTGLNVLRDGFDALDASCGMVGKMVHDGIALCATCRACPEAVICGGGYLPHRWSEARGFDNPSVWCADIKVLLAGLRERCDLAS